MLKIYPSIVTLLFMFVSADCFAQKDDLNNSEKNAGFGIFESKKEYGEFMGAVKKNPELRPMVSMINDVVLGNPIGSTSKKYNSKKSNSLEMLDSPEIRKELEIMDDQYQELQDLSRVIQQRAAKEIRSIDFQNAKNVSVRIRGIQKDMEQDLEDLLLPHQTKRLRQLHTQTRLQGISLARYLTSDPVKSELDISEDQAEQLLETEAEVEAELQEQIADLRRKAKEKVLSKLKSKQREKVNELIGEQFEFERIAKKKKTKSKANAK